MAEPASNSGSADADSLALVGMGLSNTNLFLHLARQANLIQRIADAEDIAIPKKTIYLIDHNLEHGTGSAWGRHAHPSMTANFDAALSKDGFVEWLHAKENSWKPEVEKYRDDELNKWFAQNNQALADKAYDDMFFPRFIYGMFKREKLMEAIESAPPCLEVKLLDAEVQEVRKERNGKSTITFENPPEEVVMQREAGGPRIQVMQTGHYLESANLTTDEHVMGIGHPAGQPISDLAGDRNYFPDTTALHPDHGMPGSSFPEQFKAQLIRRSEESGTIVNLAVLGSGPSSRDIINMVEGDPQLKHAVHITLISSHYGERDHYREGEDMLARVAGLESNASGIDIRTTDGATRHFDVAVQCIGFGLSEDKPVYQAALNSGTARENYEGVLEPGRRGGYVNGYPAGMGSVHDEITQDMAPDVSARLFGEQAREISQRLGGLLRSRGGPEVVRVCQAAREERSI